MKRKLIEHDRMVCIYLLNYSKKLISANRGLYICYALHYAAQELREFSGVLADYRYLRDWILKSLGDQNTYVDWIAVNHPALLNQSPNKELMFQLGRIAWIEWMIQELRQEA